MQQPESNTHRSTDACTESNPLEVLQRDPRRRAEAEELQSRLREAGVQYVYLQLVSIDGRIAGKGIPLDELVHKAGHGIQLHLAALTDLRTDRRGRYLVFGSQAPEFVALPDLATCVPLPWNPRVARCWCDLYAPDGRPLAFDPRGNLRRLERQLQGELGLRFQIGIEPEMMLLRREAGGGLVGATEPYAYHMGQLETVDTVVLDLVAAGQQMGLQMIQGTHEDAPGQVELNFMAASPLETADNLMGFRQAAVAVAKRHGLIATFMPKPFADQPANGHHHHISAQDGAETAAFAGRGPFGLSATALHFIGGLLDHAAGLTALCAPTVNSYKRLCNTGAWAPITRSWGFQNRTALVRVLVEGRIEFRLPDAACNPYLSIAAVLAAGCDGVRRQAEPGAPIADNAYEDGAQSVEAKLLPLSLPDALAALAGDAVLHRAFPSGLLDAFLVLKRDEWERYSRHVSEWERDRYLTYLP